MKVLGSFRLWLVALVAVGALVAIATPRTSADAARISHLESLVRCPSCEDLSVAQSNATTALAVRHEIVTRVHRGDSDTAILTSLEATYGTSVLLSPPTSGLGVLLWAGPVALILLAGAVATRLVRRR
ncbi:MAG TPA: cytochrome c-type biogenesis protein CcmH [Acidimicrobiales bacterium]|nr:cytochrome c-type biogenesis protein CcmH [Acidimicrobiales bacterium]